ncbi:hypothetical protein N6B72_07045 [Chryseobacterium soli]|uniref:hypothetical protein n=1 Tax=Chryseobacterium soli TaxID=445961 RepID=UPI00295498F3|nr:hypothetical protein [Chryseobacterium soli]MDV7696670.1 hypothetical protein [Chryseobacterium soli]
MKSKEELKQLFEKGDKPKQEDFWDWQDSYWHKEEKLPLEQINYDFSLKADLVNGKVPASQLPSHVDDILEFANLAAFPSIGEHGKLYIALNTNKLYRWSGSIYVDISQSSNLQNVMNTGSHAVLQDSNYLSQTDFDSSGIQFFANRTNGVNEWGQVTASAGNVVLMTGDNNSGSGSGYGVYATNTDGLLIFPKELKADSSFTKILVSKPDGTIGLTDISNTLDSLQTVVDKGNTSNKDIEISSSTKGLILRSPNGSRYKISVNDSGALITTLIP